MEYCTSEVRRRMEIYGRPLWNTTRKKVSYFVIILGMGTLCLGIHVLLSVRFQFRCIYRQFATICDIQITLCERHWPYGGATKVRFIMTCLLNLASTLELIMKNKKWPFRGLLTSKLSMTPSNVHDPISSLTCQICLKIQNIWITLKNDIKSLFLFFYRICIPRT